MQKIVDSYQFDENQVTIEDGFQIYTGKHIKTGQLFTLKKLNTKQSVDKSKFQSLLNEVSILKQLDHVNIIKCHKMLKTANNIYLVYDFHPQKRLEDTINQQLRKTTKMQKQGIIKQLCLALRQMKRKKVVHLNLNPQCIYLDQNGIVKISGFFYGDLLVNNQQVQLTLRPKVTEFTAPEVAENGIGSFASDVYSLGKIIEALNLGKSASDSSNKASQNKIDIGQVLDLIIDMTQIQPQQRQSIQNVEKFFTSNLTKSKRQIMLQKSGSQLSNNSSSRNISSHSPMPVQRQRKSARMLNIDLGTNLAKSTRSDRARDQSSSKSEDIQQINFEPVVLRIMQKRNLAILILKFSQTCSKVAFDNDLSAFLSFMMLKKSTNILMQLINSLQSGRQSQDLKLSQKQRLKFIKTDDYFKMTNYFNKELNAQKKWMREVSLMIQRQCKTIMANEKMKLQLQTQKMDEPYLVALVNEYIGKFITNQRAITMADHLTTSFLYIMIQLLQFGSYEKMFQNLINESIIDMNKQSLMTHLKDMSKTEIVVNILKKHSNYNPKK